MKSIICVILAGVLWGIISIFLNILSEMGFNSMECVCIRTLFSAIILFLYIIIRDRQKLKINIIDIPVFIGTGLFSILFFSFCYFQSIEIIGGSSVPALLLYTAPIFVMLMSAIFYKEKMTAQKIIALILTFIGLGFVTGAFSGNYSVSLSGFLFGLGAGFGYALYSIFGKLVSNKYSSITITFYTFLIASIGAVLLSGIVNDLPLLFTGKGILASLGLAFVSTTLPFMFYTIGLKGIEASKASILATVEPFMAAIVGALFFHESFNAPKIIGMIMILFAIIYLNLTPKKKLPS